MHQQKDMVPADAMTDPKASHRLAPVVAGQDLASAVIQDTVKYLGIQATGISNLNGPYLQVRPAGSDATDILLVGSWRAHFPPGGDNSGPVLDSLQPALPKPLSVALLPQTSGSDASQSIQAAPSVAPAEHPTILTTSGAAAAAAGSGPGDVNLGKPQSPRLQFASSGVMASRSRGGGPPDPMSFDRNQRDDSPSTYVLAEQQSVRGRHAGPIIEECHSDSEAAASGDLARSYLQHQHHHRHHHNHNHQLCRNLGHKEHPQQEAAPVTQVDASAVAVTVDPDRMMEDVPALQQGLPPEGGRQLILEVAHEPVVGKPGAAVAAYGKNGRTALLKGPGIAAAGALASAAAVQAAAAGSTRSTAVVPVANQLVVSPRPRSEWELDPTKIAIGRRLAVGGFGEVFLAKYEGTLVAVKRLLATDSDTAQRFVDEVHMLARLRHPNLLLFMGYTLTPEPSIVTEFMARGSLFHILRHAGNRPPDPRMQRAVAMSVARGMAYLHSRAPPILHLDLKSPNVLVDDRWRVKIADFGLSRVRQRTYVSSGAAAGSPEWMAPEVLRCDHYAEAADVYSYGVILWELLTGQAPWADLNAMQVVGAVGFARRSLPDPFEGDAVLLHLCKACRAYEPGQRPTFAQVVETLESHFSPLAVSPGNAPAALPAPEATAAAPPAERTPPSGPSAVGGAAGEGRGAGGASAPLDVAASASIRITRRHSLAASSDAADVLASAVAATGGGGGSLSSGGGPPRLDARFTSMHESPRSRRRYRSPRGEDMVGPPAITARLQDGRKTPSPRTSSGWTWQGGSDGGVAKAEVTATGGPQVQGQQPAAPGVRLMPAGASPFAAMAAADFAPDSARSLRKLRLDAIRGAAAAGGASSDGGSGAREVNGDGVSTAEPQLMDLESATGTTMATTQLLSAVATQGMLPSPPDQLCCTAVEVVPQSPPLPDVVVDGLAVVSTPAHQHSGPLELEHGNRPKGQPQNTCQHDHSQEVPQDRHDRQVQTPGNEHQAVWPAKQQQLQHRQTEQQQGQPPIALEQRIQKVHQQQQQQQQVQDQQQPSEQYCGSGPLSQHSLTGGLCRRPGHRRVNSDEASRVQHLNPAFHAAAGTAVPGVAVSAPGVALPHAQHHQRLPVTGAPTGPSSAGGGGSSAGGSGMPPLPGRRSRGLARNSAPMRYTYGGSSSGAAASQLVHPLQSPPRPRSFGHGQTMHQLVLTANAEAAMGAAGIGPYQLVHVGASTPATPGVGSGSIAGAAALSAPMSLSPVADGGPCFSSSGGADMVISAGGAGSGGGGADPWPDTHSELSFAFILRDNVSICSDDYMQGASLDRLPLLEESEMTEATGEDDPDDDADGGAVAASQEAADTQAKTIVAPGALGGSAVNTDADFELPRPFLNAMQPSGSKPPSPGVAECAQPPWAPSIASQNSERAPEGDPWAALRAHSVSGLGLASAGHQAGLLGRSANGPSTRSYRVSSGGSGAISQEGGIAPDRAAQPECVAHPSKGNGKQAAGKPFQRMSNGGGVKTYRSGRFKVTIEPACSDPPPLQHASLPQANHHPQPPSSVPEEQQQQQQLQHFMSLPQTPNHGLPTQAGFAFSAGVSCSETAGAEPPAVGGPVMEQLIRSEDVLGGPQPPLQTNGSREMATAAPVSPVAAFAAAAWPENASAVPQPQTGVALPLSDGAGGGGEGGSGACINDDGAASAQCCTAPAVISPLGESPSSATGRLRNGHYLHAHSHYSHHLHGELAAGPPVALNSVTMYRKGRFFVSHASAGTHLLSVINPNATPAQTQCHAATGCGGGSASNGPGPSGGCSATESYAEESEEHDGASGPTSPFACAVAASAPFGRTGSQTGLEGSAPQLLTAKPSWPALAALTAAQDSTRPSPMSRQYSKGRFTVAESIVAAPPADSRRPSSNSAGGAEPPATAVDAIWEPKPACLAAAAAGVSAASPQPDSFMGLHGVLEDPRVGCSFARPVGSMPTISRVGSQQATPPQTLVSSVDVPCGLASGAALKPESGLAELGAAAAAAGCCRGSGGGGACGGSGPNTAPASPRGEHVVVRRVGRFTVREVDGASNTSSRVPSNSGTPTETARGDPNAAGQASMGALPGPASACGCSKAAGVARLGHGHGHGSPAEDLLGPCSHHSSCSFASASGCSRSSSVSHGLEGDLSQPPLASAVPLARDGSAGHQPATHRSPQGTQQLGIQAAAAPLPQSTEAAGVIGGPADPRGPKVLHVKSKGRFTVIDYEAPPLPLHQEQHEEQQQYLQHLGHSPMAMSNQQPRDNGCGVPSPSVHIGWPGGPPRDVSSTDVMQLGSASPDLSAQLPGKAAPAHHGRSADLAREQVHLPAQQVAAEGRGGGLPPLHGGVLHPPQNPPSDRGLGTGTHEAVAAVAEEDRGEVPWGLSAGPQAPEERAQLQADMERLVRERMERNALEQQQQQRRRRQQEPVERARHRLGRPAVGAVDEQQPPEGARDHHPGNEAEENEVDERCTYEVTFGDGLTIQISHGLQGAGDMAEEEGDEGEDEDAVMLDVGIVHEDAGDGGSDSDDAAAAVHRGDARGDGTDSDGELQPLLPPETPAHEPAHERERSEWEAAGDGSIRKRRQRQRRRHGGYGSGDSSGYDDSMEF